MNTEDYVSFETAKLLKEKGFDEKCFMFWRYDKVNDKDDTDGISLSGWNKDDSNRVTNSELDEYFDDEFRSEGYSAPTLQMAMKWLREVHNLSVEPFYDVVLTWRVDIKHIGKPTNSLEFESVRDNNYRSYEEASEAAIKYCLENLIYNYENKRSDRKS